MKTIATILTAEQIKNDSGRNYNPTIWEQNVERYSKYNDVQFIKVEKGNGYEYERYYVAYTLADGLRLLNTFGYSSCLSNGGFAMAHLHNFTIDSNNNVQMLPENQVFIFTSEFQTSDGKKCRLNNSPEARQKMIADSVKYGQIFTKESI